MHATTEDPEISGAADSLSLDQQLCFAVYSCSNRVSRMYRLFLQPIGITFTQYLVLLALWEKDSRNISELAQVLDLEPNTITPMVKRMEILGLVSRTRHPYDERQVRVALTEKGRALRSEVSAIRHDLMERLDMPAERMAEIRAAVEQFADRVATIKA